MNNQQETVAAPVFKVFTAWFAAYGISSWSEFAALMAALYTTLLIGEWLWKKLVRPFCERRAWLVRKRRNRYDTPIDE